jgi:hypothetical protein
MGEYECFFMQLLSMFSLKQLSLGRKQAKGDSRLCAGFNLYVNPNQATGTSVR